MVHLDKEFLRIKFKRKIARITDIHKVFLLNFRPKRQSPNVPLKMKFSIVFQILLIFLIKKVDIIKKNDIIFFLKLIRNTYGS